MTFRLATPADDASLRKLLRDNPMPGSISVSLEREPSYFAAAALGGGEHQTLVAEEDGRMICCGSVTIRMRYVNGEPMRVGYLGGLRLDAACRGRATVIRRGYSFFRDLHNAGGPAIYFTSIVSENLAARRLLERGLADMPTYTFLGEFVTLAFRPPRIRPALRRRLSGHGLRVTSGTESTINAVADLLQSHLPRNQFSPVWRSDDFAPSSVSNGLSPNHFRLLAKDDGTPVACAALWDQRAAKQVVVRRYSPLLGRLRPLINRVPSVFKQLKLPSIGEPVAHAFVSHLAADSSSAEHVETLIACVFNEAQCVGIDHLLLGFDARDPRLPFLKRVLGGREYSSRIYAVHSDQSGESILRRLDGRLLAPEAALL